MNIRTPKYRDEMSPGTRWFFANMLAARSTNKPVIWYNMFWPCINYNVKNCHNKLFIQTALGCVR